MNSKKRPRDDSTSSQNEKRLRHDSPEMRDTSESIPDAIEVSGNASPVGDFENGIYIESDSMFARIELQESFHERVDECGCRVYHIEDSNPLIIGYVWKYFPDFICKNELYELTFGLDSQTQNLPCNKKRDVDSYRKVIPIGIKTGAEWSSIIIEIDPISFTLLPEDEISLNIIEGRQYYPYIKVHECCSGVFTKHHHKYPMKFVRGELPSARKQQIPTKPKLEKLLISECEPSQFVKWGHSISEKAEKMLKEFFNLIVVPDGCTYPAKYEYEQLVLMLQIPEACISKWFMLQNGHRSWISKFLAYTDRVECSVEIKAFFDPSQVAAGFLSEEFQENNEYPRDVFHKVGKPILDKLLTQFFYDRQLISQKRLRGIIENYASERKAKAADIFDWLKFKSIEEYGIFNYLENLRNLRLGGRPVDRVTASKHLNTSTVWIERRALDLKFKESKLSIEDTIQQEMGFHRMSREKFEQSRIQLVGIVNRRELPTRENRIRISAQLKTYSDTVSNFHTLCKESKEHQTSLHDYLLATKNVKWSTATIVWFYEKYWNIPFHRPCF